MSAGHATLNGETTVCSIPLSTVTLRPGVDCAACIAVLQGPKRRRPLHRARHILATVDPLAYAFGAVCGIILAIGLIGLLAGLPVEGIG